MTVRNIFMLNTKKRRELLEALLDAGFGVKGNLERNASHAVGLAFEKGAMLLLSGVNGGSDVG